MSGQIQQIVWQRSAALPLFSGFWIRHRARRIGNRKHVGTIGAVGYGACLAVVGMLAATDYRWDPVYQWGLIIGGILMILHQSAPLWARNRLRPQRERTSVSWVEENKDKLVLLALGSVLTLVVTKILPWLLAHAPTK